jgi:hypothetical protein
MRERELQGRVEALCEQYGLMFHHCKDSRWCDGHSGFPDLVIMWFGGVMFVELKATAGRMTSDQTKWRYALEGTGATFYTWYPGDLDDGTIERVFSSKRQVTLKVKAVA